MKEKIKRSILTISIFYSITVIILMIFNLNNIVVNVELGSQKQNTNEISEYKKKLLLLEENECTNTINKIIEHYDKTTYEGNVNIKELYNSENSFLNLFMETKEKCNLTEEIMDKYNFQTKFVAASIQQDELFQRYLFQYELAFKDIWNRDIVEANLNNVEYNIRKNLELEIISILIELEETNEEYKGI